METEIGRGLHWGLTMRVFKSEGTILYTGCIGVYV